MIKVLEVIRTLELGGVANVAFSFYDEIYACSKEFNIDFASGMPVEKEYDEDIKTHKSKLYRTNKSKGVISYLFQIKSIVKKGKYDVVHIHGNSVLVLPEVIGAKLGHARRVIVHCHSTSSSYPRLCDLIRPLFNMFSVERIAVSHEAGIWMFGNKTYHILKNAIDLSKYSFNLLEREKYRKQLGIENEVLLGHVGVFSETKNQSFLVRLIKELSGKIPNVRLLLIGEGEKREEVISLIKEYSVEEKVIVLSNNDEINKWMMAMDLFVMPSLFEGLPRVLVEAQAEGLTCVVSDTISKDAMICENYYIQSVNNLNNWVDICSDIILEERDRSIDYIKAKEQLRSKGFDISTEVEYLINIYQNNI